MKTKNLIIGSIATLLVASSMTFAIKGQDVISVSAAYEPTTTYTNHDRDTYYDDVDDSLTGNALLTKLRELNLDRRKVKVGYSTMGTDSSKAFKYTDVDPSKLAFDKKGQPYSTSILSFYSGNSATGFNREHVWPASRLTGGRDNNVVDDDIYMPRPTISSENSNRGNSVYVEGKCDGSKGWDPIEAFGVNGCYGGESVRGECARIIFYCMTCDSTLVLNESTSNSGNNMGKLTDLLKWNLENPVNERERNRNEGGEYLQGNRNAFVDNPDYACKIWGNTSDATKQICGKKAQIENVELDKTEVFIKKGEKVTLTPNANGTASSYTWTSYKSNVASVNNGVITATSNGETLIKVETTINSEKVCDICLVHVSDGTTPSEAKITLSDTAITIKPGATATITATPNVEVPSIIWTSSDKRIATVSGGVITAVAEGNCTITASASINGTVIKAMCEVTVSADAPDPAPQGGGGCGGSIITSSVILCSLSFVGFSLVLVKRKKTKEE